MRQSGQPGSLLFDLLASQILQNLFALAKSRTFFVCVTKNCGVTCVTLKIGERANFVFNLLAYLISAVSS